MIRAIDLFCGAGGSSAGARAAGVRIVAGFDRWELALQTFKDNFPKARVYSGKIQRIPARKVAAKLGKIHLILASPECIGHTPARGAIRHPEDTRLTAFEIIRFARVLKPRWIVIENVASMRSWRKYKTFVSALKRMGYHVRQQTLNAAKFGVPQSRKRLFIMCDREQRPPKIVPPLTDSRDLKPAMTVVDRNGRYLFSPLRTPRRARATIERARRAMRTLGAHKSFLLVYYSNDRAGGWQRLSVPLRTVTTLDRFALVRPARNTHVMRMLQPPELQAAMGFARKFKVRRATRRDRIRLLGNAVCPPVMRAVVRSLTKA